MQFLSTWFVSCVALAFTAWLLGDNMSIGDPADDTAKRVLAVVFVGFIFTVINSFVAPVIKTLSLPFVVLTLGLALLVINALLLLLTEWISDLFNLPFELNGFGWAVLASIVLSVSQFAVRLVVPDGDG